MTKTQSAKAYRHARQIRGKVCPSKKRAFETKFDAELFLFRQQAAAHWNDRNNVSYQKMPIRSYLCPYCHYYHVTSIPLNKWKELQH